jgi:hypothetical protein
MPISAFLVRKVDEHNYRVEMASERGVMMALVSLPKGKRGLTEAERANWVRRRSQQLALDFAEAAERNNTLN